MLHRVVERVVVMQIVVQQAVVLLVVMLQAVVRQVNQGNQLHKEYALLSGIVNNLASRLRYQYREVFSSRPDPLFVQLAIRSKRRISKEVTELQAAGLAETPRVKK
jgi:hypothetical protein